MKLDPYNHREKYLKWKEKVKEGIPLLSPENSDLILHYVTDMEKGINIASGSVKGPRSYIRLNTIRQRLTHFCKTIHNLYNIDPITNISDEQLIGFFSDMKLGNIKKSNGAPYLSVETNIKNFKSFWHWYQKVNRKKGIEIKDITVDLDTSRQKPKWVYLTEEEIKRLCYHAKFYYRVLIMFLFDTGMRSPSELVNIKISDFYNDFKEVNIRDETSKTFGRKIKLILSPDYIKLYIKEKNLNNEDYLFDISPPTVNKYLKRLATKLFGEKETLAGGKYSELSMYDFRHCSCCYWLPRYKSESGLKYRFGWRKSDKIHYYSEMLGMRDTISEDDMFLDQSKIEIERKLEISQREKALLQEQLNSMEEQMKKILALADKT